MLDYRLSMQEQELTIRVSRDEERVRVYASDRAAMKKLDRLCALFPGEYVNTWTDGQIMGDGLPMAKKYTFPRRYLRFGKPASAAQVEASRMKLLKINSRS